MSRRGGALADGAPGSALVVSAAVVTRGSFSVRASLRVEPGQVVAVAGPNGAGKTTVLSAVAGLVPLAAGEVRLGDQVFDDAGRTWVSAPDRRMGLVPQRHDLFAHLTALENAAFGLRARGVARREARAQAHRWLDRFGVADLADRRADRLSGGQAQRVALARAFAAQPCVLLLDEPFAALDAQVRGLSAATVRESVRAAGIPTVLVSHDADEVTATADAVVHLPSGEG